MPFAYTLFYIISLVVALTGPEPLSRACDMLFYVSPIVVAQFLVLSRVLHLCKWHRTACLLPLFPQAVSLLDYYVIELSEIAAEINAIVFLTMAVLLLAAAYNVFFK